MDVSTWIPQLQAVGAAAYAMLLGGVIGYERELKRRPAGFRTHMLVAGAAALLVAMGRLTLHGDGQQVQEVQMDPLRLVEAVVAGVAFIGAGTIFGRRGAASVAGITTAASLLMVAAIGAAAGLGHHVLAFAATLLAIVVLTTLNALERRIAARGERLQGGDR